MPTSKHKIIFPVIAALILASWIIYNFSPESKLEITFMDVGEGLCVVARTPSGRILVVDCGTSSRRKSDEVGEKTIAPYLQSLGADKIDVAVLTHPHDDHCSGFAGLLRLKPAELVIDCGTRVNTRNYRNFLLAIKRTNAVYKTAKKGQVLDFGDGVVVQILSSGYHNQTIDLNNQSVVLRIKYKSVAFIITGDAGIETENGILTDILASNTNLHSQVLQVGHHGSQTATSNAWLEAIRPIAAVISCCRKNKYGHPAESVIERLKAANIRIYRTDLNGAVSFETNGNEIKASTYKRSQ